MSGICSMHRKRVDGCTLCASSPADIFGAASWDAAVKRAEDAGKHTCAACGFVFYLTVKACPKCGHKASVDV